jgi:ribonuclease HI
VQIELWTDGACSGNPGPGGWAAILVARDASGAIAKQVELSGGDRLTTNNRMELRAVIEGLRALRRPSAVTVHIDSSYVMDAFVKRWVVGWQARGWKTSTKQPVRNQELWEALLAALAPHDVTWKKVRGHAGVELNERCDELAVAACRAAR